MNEQGQRVPTIDIRPFFEGSAIERSGVVSQVEAACRDLGFVVIAGCGVPIDLIRHTHSVAFEFFDLPEAEKERIRIGKYSRLNGFIGIQASTLANLSDANKSTAHPQELRQSLHFGPFDFPETEYFCGPIGQRYFQPNPWPQRPERLTVLSYSSVRQLPLPPPPPDSTKSGWRLPALQIERAVAGAARQILGDRPAIATILQDTGVPIGELQSALDTAETKSKQLAHEAEVVDNLRDLIDRVQLERGSIRLQRDAHTGRSSTRSVRLTGKQAVA